MLRRMTIAASAVTGLSASAFGGILVDDFAVNGNAAEFPLVYAGAADSGTDVTAIGTRVTTLDASAPYTPTTRIRPRADIRNGALELASPTGFESAVTVAYTLVAPTDLDGNAVQIAFLGYDQPADLPLEITVTLVDSDTDVSFVSAFRLPPVGGGVVTVPLVGLNPALNLDAITSLSVTFEGESGADYRIDAISTTTDITIPEPGALGLLAPVGLVAMRRRRA